MRKVTSIEVGQHNGMAGFTLYFDDENKEHYLFHPKIAQDLATKLLVVVSAINRAQPFHDDVSVSDFCQVQIKGNKDELQ